MSGQHPAGIYRRQAMAMGSSLAFWAGAPKLASASKSDPRFLLVILRGGLDGLSLVAPVGDPHYAGLRGDLAVPVGGNTSGLALDGYFSLHPSMRSLYALYKAREALFVHATATPYRGRSHFDGQDVLETGAPDVAGTREGWLNRAVGGFPSRGWTSLPWGLAIAPVVPLVFKGSARVLTWVPPAGQAFNADDATLERLLDLYAQTDPDLERALSEAMAAEANQTVPSGRPLGSASKNNYRDRQFEMLAQEAANFLSLPEGPRIGVLSYSGWDTHANAGVAKGQLANKLSSLDVAVQALRNGLNEHWDQTVIVFATEFGRTAARNGSKGTDHGTGTAAVVVGGGVSGGRVVTDWPGLAQNSLLDSRDLLPTTDLRSVFKGLLQDHLQIPGTVLNDHIFPESAAVRPLSGLLT